jgi:hypothetical protein
VGLHRSARERGHEWAYGVKGQARLGLCSLWGWGSCLGGQKERAEVKKEMGFFLFYELWLKEFERDPKGDFGMNCYGFVHSKLQTISDPKTTREHKHTPTTNSICGCNNLLASTPCLTQV